jgi:hypothetical protein
LARARAAWQNQTSPVAQTSSKLKPSAEPGDYRRVSQENSPVRKESLAPKPSYDEGDASIRDHDIRDIEGRDARALAREPRVAFSPLSPEFERLLSNAKQSSGALKGGRSGRDIGTGQIPPRRNSSWKGWESFFAKFYCDYSLFYGYNRGNDRAAHDPDKYDRRFCYEAIAHKLHCTDTKVMHSIGKFKERMINNKRPFPGTEAALQDARKWLEIELYNDGDYVDDPYD